MSHSRTSRACLPARQGFILLEGMLACVILAGAVLVVFQAIRASLQMAQSNRQFYRAALLLEERIGVREKGGEVDLEPMEDSILGSVSWQMAVLPGSDSAWPAERYTLTWGEGPRARHLELSTPVPD